MAWAQTEKAEGFKTALSLSVSLTDGNSQTLQTQAALLTEGPLTGIGPLRAGLEGAYGESTVNDQKDTTVENARAFANAKKTLSPTSFLSLDGSLLYDKISEIDYRATFGPAVGVFLAKTDSLTLSAEIGPSYVWEKVDGVTDEYLALRMAERLDWALLPTAKIWQSLEYLPRTDDFGDYLLQAELGTESALSARLSLRIVLQSKYDSTPGAGLEKNDLGLFAGLSLSL